METRKAYNMRKAEEEKYLSDELENALRRDYMSEMQPASGELNLMTPYLQQVEQMRNAPPAVDVPDFQTVQDYVQRLESARARQPDDDIKLPAIKPVRPIKTKKRK